MKLIFDDDDILIRKSLSRTLLRESEIEIVGEAADCNAATALCETHRPDIALMDICMPGFAATRLIEKRFPNIKVMIQTTFADKPNTQ